MTKKNEAQYNSAITQDWIQETLKSSQMGFWRMLIHKETGASELYADENMLESMGFPQNLSPSETFAWWYGQIPEMERDHIQKAIGILFDRPNQTFEIKYFWEHPSLGIVPVRAGGKTFSSERTEFKGIEGHQIVLHATENLESSLRRSHLNMEAMFNATPVGIAIWDLDYTVLDCNPKLLELLGVKSKQELGKTFDVFYPKYQPCGAESTEKIKEYYALAKERGSYTFEWVYTCAKMKSVPCEVTLLFTQTHDKQVYMGFLRDLTKEKMVIKKLSERQAELHEALLQADEARNTKNIFFANISHEIRTPMNAILGMSHLCLQHTEDKTIRHYLENIRRAGDSLLNVINDVLDISKIEAGKLELDHAPFSLSELLENISSTVSSLASDKPIELLFNIDPRLPNIFVGDAIRLGQVITNLFSNAIKFTQKGHIVLRITLKAKNGSLCTLGVEVADTGIGMDKERLEAIFRPFEQAEHSISRRYGGTGLGLTICKNIVEKMGGNIQVTSQEGQGTVFSFEVSLLHRREESWIDVELAQKEKILVIDDSPMACAVLKEMLEVCGFIVDTTESSQQACDLLIKAEQEGQMPYSLVILDWKMPNMSGYDCALKIKELGLKKTPALALTSGYSPHAFTEEWTEQFASFISKPVLPMPLWASVMKALNVVPLSTEAEVVEEDTGRYKKLAGRTVLLTEDNEINQEIAIALLEDLGMRIDMAENGQEAIEYCKKKFYDVVLMDIQMPIMDGLTATRYIRDLQGYGQKQIPIIAMTAHAMQMHREQSFNAGMNDHLTKPIDPNVLREALYKWIFKE